MIVFEHVTRKCPVGRHIITRECDFLEGMYDGQFFSFEGNVTLSGMTASGITKLSTSDFDVSSIELAEIELFNVNFASDISLTDIQIMLTNGTDSIKLRDDFDEQIDILSYEKDSVVVEDRNIDFIESTRFWGLKGYATAPVAKKPRNLAFRVDIANSCVSVLENGILIYDWELHDTPIDISGMWHFEVLKGSETFKLSGVRFELQKNN